MGLNKRFWFAILTILTATAFLLIVPSSTPILASFLIILSYLKHILAPIKKEFAWFLIVFICSYITESLLVNIGGAWQYNNKHLANVPIWAPLYWALICSSVVVIYEKFTK